MLGAIIGDIVGSRFEFDNTDNYNFELFTKDSTFTDDTICTIAVADAINTGANYGDKFLQWCRAYPNPKGAYGGSFARWIASDNPQPYNSFGNGSAMRVSPVAWAYDNLDKVLMEAEKTAIVTHNHPEGVKGAVAVAHAIYYLRTTHNQKVFENIMQSYYPQFMVNDYYAGVFDETCQGTVPLCLKIIRVSTSFEVEYADEDAGNNVGSYSYKSGKQIHFIEMSGSQQGLGLAISLLGLESSFEFVAGRYQRKKSDC